MLLSDCSKRSNYIDLLESAGRWGLKIASAVPQSGCEVHDHTDPTIGEFWLHYAVYVPRALVATGSLAVTIRQSSAETLGAYILWKA